jgi:hypothetical protein
VPLGAAAHAVRLQGAGELDRHDGASAHTGVMQYAVFASVSRELHHWHVGTVRCWHSALHCRARQRAGVHAGRRKFCWPASDSDVTTCVRSFSRACLVADAKFGRSRTVGAWLIKQLRGFPCISCAFVETPVQFSLVGFVRPQAALVEPAAASS